MKNILLTIVGLSFYTWSSAQCLEPSMDIWKNTWQSCQTSSNPVSGIQDHWIQYDLGAEYAISKVHVWNTNDPDFLDNGFKNVMVHYSMDGAAWNELGSYEFSKGTGQAIYGGFEGFDFQGNKARYILITALSNWGGSCFGVAEVKFNLLIDGQYRVPDEEGDDDDEDDVDDDDPVECATPVSFSVIERTDTEIHFQWQPIEGAEEYVIDYRPTGGEWEVEFTDETEIVIEDLEPNTTYEFYVTSVCEDEEESEPSDLFIIDTQGEGVVSSIDENIENNLLEIFPNPATEAASVLIKSSYVGDAQLNVVNLMGRSVYSTEIQLLEEASLFQLPIGRWSSGIYFIVINVANEEVISERLVVID